MLKQAMVFAAGLGTRLRPLTNNKPKALVEFQGVTLLEYCISNLVNQGFKKVVINIHHFPEKMMDEISVLRSKFPSVELIVSDESKLLLETGGGLEHALENFSSGSPIFIHNVDVISEINIGKLYAEYQLKNAGGIMAVSDRDTSRKLLFTDDGVLAGWENQKTREQIIVRQEESLRSFAFSGIHLLSFHLASTLKKGKYSIIDSYLEWAGKSKILCFEHSPNMWFDLGTPERLKAAGEALKTRSR